MKTAAFAMAVGATLASAATTLPEVTVKGNAFFAGSDRFYVRGIDYQPGGSSKLADPLASTSTCSRDIPEFKKLGINAVRVYTVDNSASHDTCMNMLADAGIYLILDVNSPNYSINRDDPGPSYNDVYLQNIFATIDAFANYSNTLAFFSGNEVINLTTSSTLTAPYIKAVTRDMKQYIGDRGYRPIPVGYSAADVPSNRYQTSQYLNCGADDARSDFFAFNDYSWCNPSSFQQSGWDQKVALFKNYSLPLFLSEYGCNKGTRTFAEVASLYGSDMTGVYSGGLVYEYSQEENDFGLVQINGNSVSELPDYTALKTALSGTPAPSGDGGYTTSNAKSECPAKSSDWEVDTDALPAIPDGAVKYFTQGAGPGVGLQGKGSQNAGGESTGTAVAGTATPSRTASATATGAGSSSSASGTAGSKASAASYSTQASWAPVACAIVVVFSSLFGAALL
ncbi:beta-glucanosyltransferase [Agyrium rufum]|nr:beta-glucanosyltransferase [Agyrium rufum]